MIKKRETELDILRILALLGVLFTHASGADGNAAAGMVKTFLTAVVTWHVPVFVMISGRFFLDPERDYPAVRLAKAVGRLAAVFLFWNSIYQAYYILTGTYSNLNWRGIMSQALFGPYHFWYLFMLACLYAVVPFLRRIAREKGLMEYFIALFLIFEFLTICGPKLPLIGGTIDQIVSMLDFNLAMGFSGYYILGYYLYRYPLSGKKEAFLYAFGILALLGAGAATVWMTVRGAEGKEWFTKYLMPNVTLEAAAIYTFFVKQVKKLTFPSGLVRGISRLAEYSFGIYLVHALVLDLLCRYSGFVNATKGNLRIFVVFVLGFLVSTATVALLRRIPGIGKKIT